MLGIVLSGELSIGELIVGLGTLALAFFTWQLALRTREEVTKTEESLRLTREGIEAQDMPYVIPSPNPAFHDRIVIALDSGELKLSVRLWNIGKGPAMVTEMSLRTGDGDVLAPLDAQIPVATGQAHDRYVTLSDQLSKLGVSTWSGELLILYAHASGEQYVTVSKVDVERGVVTCRDYRRAPAWGVEGAWRRSEARPPTFADER